jgi:hypothetical protein
MMTPLTAKRPIRDRGTLKRIPLKRNTASARKFSSIQGPCNHNRKQMTLGLRSGRKPPEILPKPLNSIVERLAAFAKTKPQTRAISAP